MVVGTALDVVRGTQRAAHIHHVPTDADLLRSHAELRAAIILAAREIRRLNFGRADIVVLPRL